MLRGKSLKLLMSFIANKKKKINNECGPRWQQSEQGPAGALSRSLALLGHEGLLAIPQLGPAVTHPHCLVRSGEPAISFLVHPKCVQWGLCPVTLKARGEQVFPSCAGGFL